MLQPRRRIARRSPILLLPLAAASLVLQGCPNGGEADVDIRTPDGRVSARVDQRTGAIRVDTPEGSFRGRVDPGGGDFSFAGPDGRVRVSASPYGSFDLDSRDGRVRVRTNPRGGAVHVNTRDARLDGRVRVPYRPPPPPQVYRSAGGHQTRPHLASLPAIPPGKGGAYAASTSEWAGAAAERKKIEEALAQLRDPQAAGAFYQEAGTGDPALPDYETAFAFHEPSVTLR